MKNLNGEGAVNEDEELDEIADMRRGFVKVYERTVPSKRRSHLLRLVSALIFPLFF